MTGHGDPDETAPPEGATPPSSGRAASAPEVVLTRAQYRREVLADQQALAEVARLWNPPKKTRWYESAALIGLLTLGFTSAFSFFTQRLYKKDETRLALQKARLEQSQIAVTQLGGLIAGLLLAADDRAAMAQGRYDDLDTTYLRRIRDSSDVADNRWRIGRHTSQGVLQFYFAGDEAVLGSWESTRDMLQRYADCAERVYREFIRSRAPPDACLPERDSAVTAVNALNHELLRGYRRLERF